MALAAPQTKLEAVNAMLYDVGERTTTTLTSPTRADVIRAIATLEQTSRSLQTQGWWFNTEKAELAINGSNQYVIVDDFVHVEVLSGGPTSGDLGTPQLVVRGRLLFDRTNGTDTFAGASNVILKAFRLLEYEDLPSSARDYVYAAASIRFQSRTLGSSNVDAELRASASSAIALLKEEEIDAENFDATYSSHFIDLMHRR